MSYTVIDWFYDSTPSVGPAELISLGIEDGSVLDSDSETARFTPVTALMQCGDGEVPYVFARVGSFSWMIYDGGRTKIFPFFSAKTVVTILGSNQFSFSILPNGGWWRSPLEIHFVSGKEM